MSQAHRKIKVLLLTDELEVGGTQRQMVYLAKLLDRERFEVSVLFFRKPSFFVDELTQAGIKVMQIDKRGRLDLVFLIRLVRTLRQERFDVMQCFAFSGELWGALARLCVRPVQRPVLITSVRGVYEWYSRMQWRVKRWVTAQSERVIANSRMGAQYACLCMGLPPTAVQVTYNGVPSTAVSTERVLALRSQLGLPPKGLLLLFVGRLVSIKDVPTLLRAMARLGKHLPALRLALVGEGPLKGSLMQQVQASGLQDVVQFLGQRDDVTDLIAAADIMVLTSIREGLSNVVLEGMMGGKPVVATRAGGNVELIEHDRSGLLFDIGDDAGLSEVLQQLAHDAQLRSRLGAGAQLRAQAQFGIPAMVQAYQKHYLEAVSPPAEWR